MVSNGMKSSRADLSERSFSRDDRAPKKKSMTPGDKTFRVQRFPGAGVRLGESPQRLMQPGVGIAGRAEIRGRWVPWTVHDEDERRLSLWFESLGGLWTWTLG